MSTTKSEYARKSPRTPFSGSVRASIGGGLAVAGEFVDLSSGGACVELPCAPERGQPISLVIESNAKHRGWTSASVIGSVAWCVELKSAEPEGAPRYRVGVALAATAVTRRWLEQLNAPAEAPELPTAVTNASRSRTPEGREELFQEALGALAGNELSRARELVRAALLGTPRANHLRALLMRVEAEIALAEHRYDIAQRRIEAGRRFAPDEVCWKALEGRAAKPRSRGILARLFA